MSASAEVFEAELVDGGGGDTSLVSSSALEAITRSEVDIAISTAKRFPRSVGKCLIEAKTQATSTEEIAAACSYHLRRGGNEIEGASIRLMEIMASSYGNIRFGGRVIDIDGKFVTAQGVAHDLEKNIFFSADVKRRITNKSGQRYSDDMIQTTAQAAISIAVRNALMRVIPRAYVDDVRNAALKVAVGGAATLQSRLQKMVATFAQLGVTEERILFHLRKDEIEQVDLKDLEHLIGTWTAIKEGATTVEEEFPAPPEDDEEEGGGEKKAKSRSSKLSQKLKGQKKAKKAEEETPEGDPTADAATEQEQAEERDDIIDALGARFDALKEAGKIEDTDEVWLSGVTAGKDRVTKWADLSGANIKKVADKLDELEGK